MKNENYEYLKDQYPEGISLDQLRVICQVSKRSASYLVTNGIIPSMDTGKKTWRYRIEINDVIAYLQRRDQIGSQIPKGVVSSRNKRPKSPRKSFAEIIIEGDKSKLGKYFKYIYADFPDILTAADVAEMTGLGKETVYRYIRAGKIESLGLINRKLVIQKKCIMEFVTTHEFIDCKSNSKSFINLIHGFELWKIRQLGGNK